MMNKYFFLLICCFLSASLRLSAQVITTPPCIHKTLSITLFVVRDINKNPQITPVEINNAIIAMNIKFAPICLSFSICNIKYIDNYNFDLFSRSKQHEELAKNCVKNTINVFLVNNFIDGPLGQSEFGYVSTNGLEDMIVVEKAGVKNSVTFMHLMGHYLGLYDTFETNFGKELVDGSNCLTAGDKICDTDADPYSNLSLSQVTDNVRDSMGKLYYPPLANMMSGNPYRRCNFTNMQFEKMANVTLTTRSNLW
jgi:hypothetical protein